MKRICLSVCVSVSLSIKSSMKNIVSGRDIYDLSSENDYLWEKPDTWKIFNFFLNLSCDDILVKEQLNHDYN